METSKGGDTKTGENFLLSNANLKNLSLLSVDFPEYLGERRRAYIQAVQRENKLASGSTMVENRCFTSLWDGRDGLALNEEDIRINRAESSVCMEYPEDMSSQQVTEAEAYAALFALGGYTYNNVVEEGSEEYCNSTNEGEESADDDLEGEDEGADSSPKVDEEALIRQKSPYVQKFIRDHKSLFSETLKPSRFLHCPPMKIKLKQALSSKLDPSLYKFKPRTIPKHIKDQAKQLLDDLVEQGIIRRLGPNEKSDVCALAGFVPKKSKKLRFVIDFTSLNKYIERPVHSFPSTDHIQQAIRHNTRFMACVDFPSGYFQLRLDKGSQSLTVFNTEFWRYLFLRALQGLSSSGDAFNANTDRFYS